MRPLSPSLLFSTGSALRRLAAITALCAVLVAGPFARISSPKDPNSPDDAKNELDRSCATGLLIRAALENDPALNSKDPAVGEILAIIGSDFSRISLIFEKLPARSKTELDPEVDARRLINLDDWTRAQEAPWNSYGEKTTQSWMNAARHIRKKAADGPRSLKLSPSLLLEIHRIATDGMKFHGFEGRRLLDRKNRGEITQEQFKELLHRAYGKNEELAGVPHDALRGVYRSDPLDQIEHRGSSFNSDATRYFTRDELDAIRKNPYMTLDETTLREESPGKWKGVARYLDVSKVPDAVTAVLNRAELRLKNARTKEEIVEITIDLQRELVSIHPFLDGNGRTIRLLGDLIYESHGLPPPLYANENELTMSREDAKKHVLEGMSAYLMILVSKTRRPTARAPYSPGRTKPPPGFEKR